MVTDDSNRKMGNIVLVVNAVAPYDSFIERQVRSGAKAVVFLRDRSGVPGQTMYVVTGRSQAHLTIPVVEIFQVVSNTKYPLSKMLSKDGGLEVSLWPQENEWKVANDKTGFQVTLNLFVCLWAIGIICVGLLRLNEWWSGPGWRFVTIGTVCIVLELISAVLRIALCIVDPFWSFRILSDPAQNILITANLPFTFAAGILLTFFWAETLKSQRIRASPFISEYRKIAIGVVIFLFVAEITTAIVRWKLASYSAFNPTWITQALYVITSIVLTICYVICAVKIRERLREIGGNKKQKVRNMTMRFVGSTVGYLSFSVFLIALIPCLNYPWAFKCLLNGVAIASNFWSTLQVYSFRPPRRRSGTSHSSHGTDEGTSMPGLKSQKSDFSLSARPRRHPGETDAETTSSETGESDHMTVEDAEDYDLEKGEKQIASIFDKNGNSDSEISPKIEDSDKAWNAAVIPPHPTQAIDIEAKNDNRGSDSARSMANSNAGRVDPSPSNETIQPNSVSPVRYPLPILIKNQSRSLSGVSVSPKQVSFNEASPRHESSRSNTSLASSNSSSSSEAPLIHHSLEPKEDQGKS